MVTAARAAATPPVREPTLTAHQPAKINVIRAPGHLVGQHQTSAGINHLPYITSFVTRAPNGEYDGAGCNSSRGIVTFIDVHRRRLNEAFGLSWRRAPAHTAIRYILQRLDPAAVEASFRRHAALLQAARATSGQGCIALDGKTLRGSFDNFRDRAAAQVLSAFATDTALVLAHIDIAEKSNEIPAAQKLLAELGLADGAIVTMDALHCQKKPSRSRPRPILR